LLETDKDFLDHSSFYLLSWAH